MEELNLIQTHLGIWKLSDWSIDICNRQLSDLYGVYCIQNNISNKILIGEGKLGGDGGRVRTHFRESHNTIWNKDVELYGKENFNLQWIIVEEDETSRKIIENKFHIYLKENCYNIARKIYPTREELISEKVSKYCPNTEVITKRLNNYTKIQKINGFDECWESNWAKDTTGYGQICFKQRQCKHHILMYILHYGDICGISSVIHHKCENKKCVNPEHLELCTHSENIRKHHKSDATDLSIINLHNSGLTIHEISKKLNIGLTTICRRIKFIGTSNYVGVNRKKDSWECNMNMGTYPNRASRYLGLYNTELEAAQNRDYYIIHNNLLSTHKLNFYNINYKIFTPHLTKNKIINKYLV